jgi:hypothetical protein
MGLKEFARIGSEGAEGRPKFALAMFLGRDIAEFSAFPNSEKSIESR